MQGRQGRLRCKTELLAPAVAASSGSAMAASESLCASIWDRGTPPVRARFERPNVITDSCLESRGRVERAPQEPRGSVGSGSSLNSTLLPVRPSAPASRPREMFERSTTDYCELICRFRQCAGLSPLGVFLHGYLRHPPVNASTSGRLPASESAALFPSPVPYPEVRSAPPRRGHSKAQFRRLCAQHAVNILFGHFSFIELGCPRKAPEPEPRDLSPLQDVAARDFEEELLSFIRSDRGMAASILGGGRARLASCITALTQATPGDFAEASSSTTALPVDPDRVALPERAGAIDPAQVLPPQYRDAFLNWEEAVRLDSSE